MRIVHARPPNFDAICKAFPFVRDATHIVFAYGDRLFVPGGVKISHDLMVHEEVHGRQQAAIGVGAWWAQYLADAAFRLHQEVEAYHAQYRSMSRPQRDREIRRLAGDLAGPMYGGLVTFEQAKKLIREGIVHAAV